MPPEPASPAPLIEALATVVVAIFGTVQVVLEILRRLRERRAARKRASTLAFLLRRQLQSWLGVNPPNGSGVAGWVIDSRTNGTLNEHLDIAEARTTDLADLSHLLPNLASQDAQGVLVLFLGATTAINLIASDTVTSPQQWQPSDPSYAWRDAAQRNLAICVEWLERSVIEPTVLAYDKKLVSTGATGNLSAHPPELKP